MDLWRLFFREQSLSKVAAVFDNLADARLAAETVKHLPGMHDRQVQLVYGHDREWGRKVEPEGVGIWRTAIRAHVTCGAIGLAVGLILYAILYGINSILVTSSPLLSFIAIAFFPTIFGFLVGGLLTIRPDHDGVVQTVSEAASQGRCAVVVHPSSRTQFEDAQRALDQTGAMTAHTL